MTRFPLVSCRLLHLLLALQDGTGRGALSAAVRSAAEACEAVVVLSQGSDGARGTEGPSTETWECVLYLASAAVALPEGKGERHAMPGIPVTARSQA